MLLALTFGLVGGALAWFAMSPVLANELLARRNFRDRQVPVAGGLVLVVAVVGVFALLGLVAAWNSETFRGHAQSSVLVATIGFGLLGFVDDVLGSSEARGFRGHLRSLVRGRLTAGGLKLVGGTATAIIAVSLLAQRPVAQVLVDAALIALAANLANLFDLAPGRTLKVGALAFGALVLAAGPTGLQGVGVAIGASLALLWPDLRERVMLGDTGANPLGAIIGLGAVLTCAPATRLVIAGVLLALNVASEMVSFSRVIAALPPLRLLDAVGRMK